MKKSLIALAVLAASGAAMAQSSVTVYGVADIWFGKTSEKDTVGGVTTKTTQTKLDSGGAAGSRIGFKGTEDLGGGLKANFVLEQGFNIDTGAQSVAGAAFGRTASVGLSGNFGSVDFGRVWTAYDDVWGFSNNNFDTAFTARPMAFGYTDNPNNGIRYTSPSFGGFSGALSYAMGEDKATGVKAGRVLALNVKYENGPLAVAFAHQAEKAGDPTKNTLNLEVFESSVTPGTLDVVTGTKLTNNLIGATYDFGSFKLLGNYNQGKLEEPGSASEKSSEYSFGVQVPLTSALSVAAGYGQAKLKVGGVEDTKAKQYAISAVYTLSKRTFVYAGYKSGKETEVATGDNVKTSLYAVGINHKF